MGYTHSFGFKNETLSQRAMNKIAQDMQTIEAHFNNNTVEDENGDAVIIADYWGKNKGAEYTSKTQNGKTNITACGFNGLGEGGHETLSFTVGEMPYDFCKTNRRSYDIAVSIMLLCAKFHLNSMSVKSDGIEEWDEAIQLFKELFPTRAVSFELEEENGSGILKIKKIK